MTADRAGVAAAQPPPAPAPGGRRDRIALASANVPYRLKVAVVWVLIIALLAFLFWAASFDNTWIRGNLAFIAGGLTFTIALAAGGIVLAIVLALLGALGRLSKNPVAYGLSGFYTSFFRGTPLIVQLFLFYLALPRIGINLQTKFPGLPEELNEWLTLSAFSVGVVVLGLNYGAYMTEIFRAGIESVSHGQSEAAEALGMTYRQKMRRVVLPQALRVIVPPTGNEFIAMTKDTALISFLGTSLEAMEIFRRGQLLGAGDAKPLEGLITVAALYWILTIILTLFQSRLERRLGRGYVLAEAGPRRRWRPGAGVGGPATVAVPEAEPGMAVEPSPERVPGQGL